MLTTCVLVVERDPALRHIMASWLRASGYDVLAASDADDACALSTERAQAGRLIDAVAVDWTPGGGDGEDIVARLGRCPASRHACVVLITDKPHTLPAWALRRTSVRSVIGRPFGLRSLLSHLAAALDPDAASSRLAA